MTVVNRDTDAARRDRTALAVALFRMGAATDCYTSQVRRALGLNAHERLALSALWSEGPATMSQLGARIPLSRAAVTTLVDRLEGAGLVRRQGDGSDRRRTVVEITEAAMDRLRPVTLPFTQDLLELAAGFDAGQWQVISSFVEEYRLLNERHAARLAAMTDDEIQALAAVDQ